MKIMKITKVNEVRCRGHDPPEAALQRILEENGP